MKRLISILAATTMIWLSPPSIAQSGNVSSTPPTSMKQRVVKHVPKVKIFRSNPFRYHAIYVDQQDDIEIDDEGLMTPYRREDLFKIVQSNADNDLPQHILDKLAIARKNAMIKYQQTWG